MEREIFCFIHEGGELLKCNDGSVEYKGGRTSSIVVHPNISFDSFVEKVCAELSLPPNSFQLHFTVKFDPFCMLPLQDDAAIVKMFRFNDMFCRIYLSSCNDAEDVVLPASGVPTPMVGSNSAHDGCIGANTRGDPPTNICTELQVMDSYGLSSTCVGSHVLPLDSTHCETTIMGPGQTFRNANEFRDAVYLMSLAGRFRYRFKRNSSKHMTVVCKVDECPWKVTGRAIRGLDVVQVHTFLNVHKHSVEDVASCQPLVRSNRASLLIDNVIRSTPDYQPHQICKDFIRHHGLRLSYNQAWQVKEKAKERIFGLPSNYYKLLPWMCQRIVQTNPGTIAEFTHSSDDHFQQLFIAYSISIQGFATGCRPIIAIDSSHMSGPYGGVLVSATSYDANDSMFPLAYGVMNSENYDDWLWFLKHLKRVVGNRDVVIVSDRHPALLRSVSEIFGVDNHAYCYRYLKENFSTFMSKQGTKGSKAKENALQFLDSIAYARLDHDYDVSMAGLRKLNDALATWVEANEPEHWAMSKFPKKRWDKMTTNLAESFNSWLHTERHHSICNFLMEHMKKLGAMLVKHKEESLNWKGAIGPNIEEHIINNIAKAETLPVAPFMNGVFRVCIGPVFLNVDITNRTCTCRGWQMLGLPCEHASAVLLSIGQSVTDFVEDWYKSPNQKLIYSGSFSGIETHDMPSIGDDGVVRDMTGRVFSSLNPPQNKRPPGRPRKKRIESQFMDKRTVYCSRCNTTGHNRKTCKNPLP